MSTPEMDAWVSRLLGVAVASAGRDGSREGDRASTGSRPLDLRPVTAPTAKPVKRVSADGRARWADARDQVNAQVGRLMGRMETSGDPDLERIADLGFAALTRGLNTSLATSLIEVDAAPPDRVDNARAKALAAIADMRRFIGSDPLVALMDDNPMGVAVDIRGTLGAALHQIEEALA